MTTYARRIRGYVRAPSYTHVTVLHTTEKLNDEQARILLRVHANPSETAQTPGLPKQVRRPHLSENIISNLRKPWFQKKKLAETLPAPHHHNKNLDSSPIVRIGIFIFFTIISFPPGNSNLRLNVLAPFLAITTSTAREICLAVTRSLCLMTGRAICFCWC
jgi:hypothetical protein